PGRRHTRSEAAEGAAALDARRRAQRARCGRPAADRARGGAGRRHRPRHGAQVSRVPRGDRCGGRGTALQRAGPPAQPVPVPDARRPSLSYDAPHTVVPPLRPRAVGARAPRVEDAQLLTGRAAFIGDLVRPRLLDVGFVRSPIAHARLAAVETARAAEAPGIEAVWTARDVLPLCAGLEAGLGTDGLRGTVQPLLADGAVRYVGEPIAAVVGADRYVVEDAAGLVDVDLEPETPLLGWGGGEPAYERDRTFGAPVAGALSVAGRYAFARVTQLPLETCGCVAEHDWSTGRLTLWTSTQMPFVIRSLLASHLGHPEHLIDVV